MKIAPASSIAFSVLAIGTLLLTTGQTASAHPDDPKVLDRMPPVVAEAYRRDDPQRGTPEFDSLDVELLSWLPINVFNTGANGAADIWGYTSPSGREYALLTLSNALSFVEVTNPGDAQIIGTFPAPQSLWHDVKVYGHHAYAVSEGGGGIRIYDMSGIDSGQITLVGAVLEGGTAATHNVAINTESGYLYRTGGQNNGLRIYSLANPAAPQLVGSWSDRYVHDAQVVTYPSVMINGQLAFFREIAFCCSGFNGGQVDTGLTILDVTNKSNPVVLAQTAYSDRAYSHQAWLSEDRKYLFLNDELDEQNFGMPTTTRVFDVSDLGNPVEVTTFTNGSSAIDHNLYVKGDLMYAANYRSGLRIFDVSDPLEAEEIAYFNTFPGSDSANFNGAWSSYPFFESGTIIVSDIERGLFVLKHQPRQLQVAAVTEVPAIVSPAGQTIELTISEVNGGQFVTGSARLLLDRGDGVETFPLLFQPGGTYRADFPAMECNTSVTFSFAADAANGTTATLPSTGQFQAVVATDQLDVFQDQFDTDTGWVIGAPDDDATSGIWVRANPNGTIAQPSSPLFGNFCYITGQHPGGGAGANDVDNGKTTLTTPLLDLAANGPGGTHQISYWRWYSNSAGANPNNDIFVVDISADNGQTWVNVETVGPAGPEVSGGWFQHAFNPADLIT
ncbi:MAG: choice-of-anchor B family protein, partial [Phycisphaerales bacterium]